MEWLFGSIKKTPKPEVYVSNVVEGDFNVVSSQEPARPPYPLYPSITTSHYAQRPYPPTYSGYGPQQPHYSQQYQRQYVQQISSTSQQISSSVDKPVNPLDSIPFKISSSLDSKSLPVSDYQLRSIKNQLDSVSNRINSDSYNYSFELERSVLSEANY